MMTRLSRGWWVVGWLVLARIVCHCVVSKRPAVVGFAAAADMAGVVRLIAGTIWLDT